MFKKKAKAAQAAGKGGAAAPKARSKLKIAILALTPLVGAGAGYAGWPFYAGAHTAEAAHGAEGGGGHGQSEAQAPVIPPEVLAETSATYSFALAQLVRQQCGAVATEALKAASQAEAEADGALVNLSWMAALRRTGSFTERSCNRILVEIDMAEAKAARVAAGEDDEQTAGHH